MHLIRPRLTSWDGMKKPAGMSGLRKFRDSVMQILNNADPADLEAAGISVQEIEEELSGSDSISLVTACAIADKLGESLDSLLGHTPKENDKGRPPAGGRPNG